MRLILALSILAFLTSCNPRFYSANRLNIPNLEKGTGLLSTGAYVGDGFFGGELQYSYRPFKHMIMNTNLLVGNSGKVKYDELNRGSGGSGMFGEFGIGPYYEINDYFSASGLLGMGFGHTQYLITDSKSEFDFHREYLQAGINYHQDKFYIGSGFRLARLEFYNAKVNSNIDLGQLNVITNLTDKSTFLIPEFGVNLGFKVNKFHIEYSITNLLFNKSYKYQFAQRAIGLNLIFSPSIFSKKNKN